MLDENELERLLEKSFFSNVSDAVAGILDKVLCCPVCRELFPRSDDVKEHLQHDHAEQFTGSGGSPITRHIVQEGSESILICPHCRFAVGVASDIHKPNPSSTIFEHVQECPMNLRSKGGPGQVSYYVSHDAHLIDDYLSNKAEIELFPCAQCNELFGSVEALLQHLVKDHSCPSADDLPEAQLHSIRRIAQRYIDERQEPVTPPVAVQTTQPKIGSPSPQVVYPKDPPAVVSPVEVPIAPQNMDVGKTFIWTARALEIGNGCVCVPDQLTLYLPRSGQVEVLLGGKKESNLIHLDSANRHLTGLTDWIHNNAIEVGDKIAFQLLSLDPVLIRVWTDWKKSLSAMLACPPEDFEWRQVPIRDCLLRVFASQPGPMHYKSLYSRISRHRELAVSSVIATLSRWRGVLFEHSSQGMWYLLQGNSRDNSPRSPAPRGTTVLLAPEVSDRVWQVVSDVEEHDVVYKLLKKTRDSLSYDQICQRIADARGVDWHELEQTGFINANDERLVRLDNGHFALREWTETPCPTPPAPPPEPPLPAREDEADLPRKEPIRPDVPVPTVIPGAPTVPRHGLLWRLRRGILRVVQSILRWIERKLDE